MSVFEVSGVCIVYVYMTLFFGYLSGAWVVGRDVKMGSELRFELRVVIWVLRNRCVTLLPPAPAETGNNCKVPRGLLNTKKDKNFTFKSNRCLTNKCLIVSHLVFKTISSVFQKPIMRYPKPENRIFRNLISNIDIDESIKIYRYFLLIDKIKNDINLISKSYQPQNHPSHTHTHTRPHAYAHTRAHAHELPNTRTNPTRAPETAYNYSSK